MEKELSVFFFGLSTRCVGTSAVKSLNESAITLREHQKRTKWNAFSRSKITHGCTRSAGSCKVYRKTQSIAPLNSYRLARQKDLDSWCYQYIHLIGPFSQASFLTFTRIDFLASHVIEPPRSERMDMRKSNYVCRTILINVDCQQNESEASGVAATNFCSKKLHSLH